ncbi:DUF4873 domain-containing protein [Nocardia spumae]|uniref:DUF4873 domain-containing protein n=1 Tax=Nocardia spumae TaxID=2887190 RepID=UPI001D13C81A|nr:DUF4873 domain-containing protein [Nocardia spumae]
MRPHRRTGRATTGRPGRGVIVVAERPAAPVVVAALRRHGIDDVTVLGSAPSHATAAPESVHRMEFDGTRDIWHLHTAAGIVTAAVVIMSDAVVDERRVLGADGRTLREVLDRGPAAHLGVALHDLPNLFWTHTPASAVWPGYSSTARAEYAARCTAEMRRTGCTRIRLRRAVQHESARRWAADPRPRRHMPSPDDVHFDLTVAADRVPAHDYAGPAILDAPGAEVAVTATLSGHSDPIDGRYHWYGRLHGSDADALPAPGRGAVSLRVPGAPPATGRLQERDPWGNLRIAGIGRPPFPMADTDIR